MINTCDKVSNIVLVKYLYKSISWARNSLPRTPYEDHHSFATHFYMKGLQGFVDRVLGVLWEVAPPLGVA